MTGENEGDEKEAEAVLEQSKNQRRHTTEPDSQPAGGDDAESVGRVGAIKEALVAIEEGDPENINVRDAQMKALLVGLDDAGFLDDVAAQLADRLGEDGVDKEEVFQSDVARLLMRVGLREALPEVREDADKAARQKAVEQETGY